MYYTIMDTESIVANLLNTVKDSRLENVASKDEWLKVVTEYFCQPTESELTDDDDDDTSQAEDLDGDLEPDLITVDAFEVCEKQDDLVLTDDVDKEWEKVKNFRLAFCFF